MTPGQSPAPNPAPALAPDFAPDFAPASASPLHAAAFTFLVAADIAPPIGEMHRMIGVFLKTPLRPEPDQNALLFIAEEWATNLRKHGCAEGARHVASLSLKNLGFSVSVRLEDDCPPFDPTALEPRTSGGDRAERQGGGLGLRRIRSLVEQMRYRRENGKNIWEMLRRIKAA